MPNFNIRDISDEEYRTIYEVWNKRRLQIDDKEKIGDVVDSYNKMLIKEMNNILLKNPRIKSAGITIKISEEGVAVEFRFHPPPHKFQRTKDLLHLVSKPLTLSLVIGETSMLGSQKGLQRLFWTVEKYSRWFLRFFIIPLKLIVSTTIPNTELRMKTKYGY